MIATCAHMGYIISTRKKRKKKDKNKTKQKQEKLVMTFD